MATTYSSTQMGANRPPPTVHHSGQVTVVPFSFLVSAALVINDVIEFCKLPAQHVPVDLFLDLPDLDTNGAPALVHDVGLWEDDDGVTPVDQDAFVAASTVGQAAGLLRALRGAFLSIAASDSARVLAMKVTTAPATGATAVTIRGWFSYRPAGRDD